MENKYIVAILKYIPVLSDRIEGRGAKRGGFPKFLITQILENMRNLLTKNVVNGQQQDLMSPVAELASDAGSSHLVAMDEYSYIDSAIQRKVGGKFGSSDTAYQLPTSHSLAQSSSDGLPPTLKMGIESLSGLALDDVRVHYNSPRPAQMQALAYTRGAHIHVGPGQEQHLPHEAWHYVQQAQGRVKPTSRQGQETLNDDTALEREADVMGMRAMSGKSVRYDAFGRNSADGGDGKQTPLNACTYLSASPVMQLRRVALTYLNSSGGIDAGMAIETKNISWEKLEDMLFNESLSSQSKLELMRAIDAGEVQGGYPGALKYATGHLGFIRTNLPTKFGDQNEFTWIRRITGGGSRSLTGKREGGAIKTDMTEEEYVATEEITRGFYGTADRLNVAVPREHFLTLYRGFTIPALKQQSATGSLVEKIEGYNDVLPSSASWQREQAIEMSKPGEGESAVLMYMAIPQDHPIVIMSYPDNENTSEARPKPLDIGQAEVLIGASSNQNVEIFKTEQLPNGRIRYHVSTTLQALGPDTVMAGIKRARDQAEATRPLPPEMLDLESDMLVGRFGADVSARIISESAIESDVSRIYVDVEGESWKLISGDPHFGYMFSSVE